MRSGLLTLAVFAAAALILGPMRPAQALIFDPNVSRCEDPNPDVRILGCTALIQSGQEIDKSLAASFNNRGMAYNEKGEFNLAIADFDQAIRLRPDDAYAFYNRGNAH